MDRVHLYTFCWNEQFIIPFFLQHYQEAVGRIVVYDNESTDQSVEILSRHEKVSIRSYSTNDSIDASIRTPIRNNMWKESRGQAEWVIVLDIDEFLHHPAGLRAVLDMADAEGASLVIPEGFDMVSEDLPCSFAPILEQVQRGVGSPGFSKPCIFKPDRIQEINLSAGGHTAEPTGDVKIMRPQGLQLRHCKYLSYDYYAGRSKVHSKRVNPVQRAAGLNVHYIDDDAKLRAYFDWLVSQAREMPL